MAVIQSVEWNDSYHQYFRYDIRIWQLDSNPRKHDLVPFGIVRPGNSITLSLLGGACFHSRSSLHRVSVARDCKRGCILRNAFPWQYIPPSLLRVSVMSLATAWANHFDRARDGK
jgi:hypothetical protein